MITQVSRDSLALVLKGVSRSFYLTLRLLPKEMRQATSLGYLLARTSDTIADTPGLLVTERMELLATYARAVSKGDALPVWPESMLERVSEGERVLLEHGESILRWLSRMDAPQAGLIREVVEIIISGQVLDLRRFGDAVIDHPVAMPSPEALDEYTWCVAGCVGAFWTKLGFLTLGEKYSTMAGPELLEHGISYGKGLQLVNILRDLPVDLMEGRCYLPVKDPNSQAELMGSFRLWHSRASANVERGVTYASTLRQRRLRAATVLPALIAKDTLDLLENVSWGSLQRRVKVSRSDVFRALAEAFLF